MDLDSTSLEDDSVRESLLSPLWVSCRAEECTAKDMALVRLKLLWRVISCRERPHFCWIHSKGAILVLLWMIVVPQYEIFIPTTSFHVKGLAIVVFSLFPGTLYTPSLPNSWLAGRHLFWKVSSHKSQSLAVMGWNNSPQFISLPSDAPLP